MRARLLSIVGALALSAILAAEAQNLGGDLQRAKQREVNEGCKAALPDYERLAVQGAKSNRAVAAEALLRTGECHEKNGSTAEALRVYGQLIRDYNEYSAVVADATARTAVLTRGNNRPVPAERLAMTIPALDEAISHVSRDGRYVVVARYGDGSGALGTRVDGVLHDLRTGAQRLVIERSATEAYFWPISAAISNDGRQLAYVARFDRARGQTVWQVRIADLNGSGVPTGRVIAETVSAGGTCGFVAYTLFDWTADARSIAIRVRVEENRQQLALMSVRDGSLQVLKTMAERVGPFDGALSPDGRYLAAEVAERQGSTCAAVTRNITILPLDGGNETPVVQFPGDDRLMGWSPDGRAILFTSRRGGDSALWMQQLSQGRGVPEALIVRAGYTPTASLGLTDAGSLFTVVTAETDYRIKEASFDFETGSFTSALNDMPLPFLRSNRSPRWSPDGRWLAYVSDRPFSDRIIVVRSTETGTSRELEVFPGFGAGLWTWTPDSGGLVTVGLPGPAAGAGRSGLSFIDARTNSISPLAADARAELPEWSADGRTMFYDRSGAIGAQASALRIARELASNLDREIGPAGTRLSPDGRKSYMALGTGSERRIVERDLATSTERDLLKIGAELVEWHLLAQERILVAVSDDAATQETVLTIGSTVDGTRTSIRLRPSRLRVVMSAPDHRALILRQATNEPPFWWVPLDGRTPKRLAELEKFDRVNTLSLHPDGRRLAIGVSYGLDPGHQLRVLENILPPVRR